MIPASFKDRKQLYTEEKLQDQQDILLHPFWDNLPSPCGVLWFSISNNIIEESRVSAGTHALSPCSVRYIHIWIYINIYPIITVWHTYTCAHTYRKREISGYNHHHMALFTDQGLLIEELNTNQILTLVQLCVQTRNTSSIY